MNKTINYLSVSDLNRYLYYKFDTDPNLQIVHIEGELSNVKLSGKHYYFSLKDQNSEISCMFFYPANLSLKFRLNDGMSVQVSGKIQVYQKRGTYSCVITQMQEVGLGILYTKYLELKQKLEEEGLFKDIYKKPIPEYPEHVAIITAATGEAINDIVSTFNRRFPLARLSLYPALVQGMDAPKDLIRALDKAYLDSTIDCLIIGRGGGSFEDLNAFNDEMLARKLFEAPFPTISAVGHEGDYTICDFVCSKRAPTPTGAAMFLSKEKTEVNKHLTNIATRLCQAVKAKVINSFERWKGLNETYHLAHFEEILNKYDDKITSYDERLKLLTPDIIASRLDASLDNYQVKLNFLINNIFKDYETKLNVYAKIIDYSKLEGIIEHQSLQLNSLNDLLNIHISNRIKDYEIHFNKLVDQTTLLNPLNIINNGYSIVYKDDEVITKASQLKEDDEINIRFSDGIKKAIVR